MRATEHAKKSCPAMGCLKKNRLKIDYLNAYLSVNEIALGAPGA